MIHTGADGSASVTPAKRVVGQTGVAVHPLAIDGSLFGWVAGVDETTDVLDRFVEAGGNLISTADHYAGGRSEVMIGSWLRTKNNRGDLVLATKVGRHPDARGLAHRTILRAVDTCLARLGTDYIDFLSFDGEHLESPIDESLEAADRLIREGKVRFLSAAGYSASRFTRVQSIAAEAAYPQFRAMVVEYNLMERIGFEGALQVAATDLGTAAFVRLPLASGYLTGRFRTRDDLPDSVMFGAAMQYIGRRGNHVLAALDAVAHQTGETPARVAIAWVLHKPGVAAAVVRAKDTGQLDAMLGAASLRLSRHQIGELDRASGQ